MSYNLTLNSSNVVGNNNSQFEYKFIQGALEIDNNSEIQLTSLTYPYSMRNVTSAYGNNNLSYLAPIPTNTMTINTGYYVTDPNTGITTGNSGTSSNSIILSSVTYIEANTGFALTITGATGVVGALLVTSVSASSGTVTVTINQNITWTTGSAVTIWYSNASRVAINVSGAGNYIYPNWILYGGVNLNNYIDDVSANSGLVILSMKSTTYLTTTTSGIGTISFQAIVNGSNRVTTFAASFTSTPLLTNGNPYIFTSSWSSIQTVYGVPSSNYLYNISLITGTIYKCTINSQVLGLLATNATATINQNYFPVSIPDGFYTTALLNSALQSTLNSNGHYWYNSNAGTPLLSTIIASSGSGPYTGTLTFTGTAINNTAQIGSTVATYVSPNQFVILGTITAQPTITTYTISGPSAWSAISTAQNFYISNNNEVTKTITYPLSITTNTSLYTTNITSSTVPTQANILSYFSLGWMSANGYNGTNNWIGTYPTSTGSCFQLIIPTTTKTTNTIGNILGFTGGFYPSTNSGITTVNSVVSGNSLSAFPPFPPLGSIVNAIVVRCNLVNNSITIPSDILQTIPITTTYGSNINFISPNSSTFMKLKPGRYNSVIITLVDQNNNPIIGLDPNCLISLTIKKISK